MYCDVNDAFQVVRAFSYSVPIYYVFALTRSSRSNCCLKLVLNVITAFSAFYSLMCKQRIMQHVITLPHPHTASSRQDALAPVIACAYRQLINVYLCISEAEKLIKQTRCYQGRLSALTYPLQ